MVLRGARERLWTDCGKLLLVSSEDRENQSVVQGMIKDGAVSPRGTGNGFPTGRYEAPRMCQITMDTEEYLILTDCGDWTDALEAVMIRRNLDWRDLKNASKTISDFQCV